MPRFEIPTRCVNNFCLPVLGLGTYQMGGGLVRNPANDDTRDVAGIRAAIGVGVTHIDTAEKYAAGHCERLVAKAIAGTDRSKLFITSKVYWNHLRHDDVIAACQASLDRLGIKQLDLYLIHGPNPEAPLSETMRAMDWLVENGLTRFIGVSNFDVPLLQEAARHTKYGIVNNQIHYSLIARAYEENGTLEYCRTNGILVTAFRPVGKYGELSRSGIRLLDELAARYHKTPAQVAINWVINKPNVVALVKTSNPLHLAEDLGVLGWSLNAGDVSELDKNFPVGDTINVPPNFR